MTRAKIVFAGPLDRHSTARHRMMALGRLGHEVIGFDVQKYTASWGKVANWIYHRALIGPAIRRINQDFKDLCESARPDFVLVDKGIFFASQTIQHISNVVAPIIHYPVDNPFGPRHDPGWRLFLESIPFYDIHFVPRAGDIENMRTAGGRNVFQCSLLGYEPTIHYPPPPTWNEHDRTIDVSFTGSPYDDRAEFFTTLLRRHGITVNVRGDRWQRALSADVAAAIYNGGAVYESDYRLRFWQSRICLSFVTHSNLDEVAHKSFEIAASGGFLLAEATEGHLASFEDGKEAVFFSDATDCARLIRRYLPDVESRRRIAAAGHRRSIESGYSNDARLRNMVNMINTILPSCRQPRG